jgi:VWFA-related protein
MRLVPLLVGALLAQDPGGRATFSSRTDLVVLHVTVLERHAGFVADLPRDAFVVRENGREQPIAVFAQDDTPVTVGMVIDNSGSMVRRRDAVIAAGLAFAESSHPADELFTINFNERIWPGLPPGRLFTSDHQELRAALGRSTARGQTALFDALVSALAQLDRGAQPRKVLVVVSDGGDNASRARFEDVIDAALRRDVVIYAIGLADPDDKEAKPERLRELASVTGGEAFFPRANDEITPVLERIARDIRSSYTIGYAPPAGNSVDRRRHVQVDVRHPGDRRKLSVRARTSYIAPGAGSGR